jgi:hypothetical protein
MPYYKNAIDIITADGREDTDSSRQAWLRNGKYRTTTNIAEIRKNTEQSLVELPFEVATQKIAKTGAGCAGISLQKAWEEAFYWISSRNMRGRLTRCRKPRDPMTDLPRRQRRQLLGSLK